MRQSPFWRLSPIQQFAKFLVIVSQFNGDVFQQVALARPPVAWIPLVNQLLEAFQGIFGHFRPLCLIPCRGGCMRKAIAQTINTQTAAKTPPYIIIPSKNRFSSPMCFVPMHNPDNQLNTIVWRTSIRSFPQEQQNFHRNSTLRVWLLSQISLDIRTSSYIFNERRENCWSTAPTPARPDHVGSASHTMRLIAWEERMVRIIEFFFLTLKAAIALLLAGMVVLVFGNVVLRYAFNAGITYSEELSRIFFVWLTFLGAVVAMREHAHLGMDSLLRRMPPSGAKIAVLSGQALMLWATWLMISGSWTQTLINLHVAAPATGISMGIFYGAGIAFGVPTFLIILWDAFGSRYRPHRYRDGRVGA